MNEWATKLPISRTLQFKSMHNLSDKALAFQSSIGCKAQLQ